jgi:DNA-binding beta-propeller fold protein YncE
MNRSSLKTSVALAGVAIALVAAAPTSAPAAFYRITATIPGPDGGWDLASVDPVAHRLYVARTDGVMAVDLRTGKVTSGLVPSQRGHAALAIPGTREIVSTNGTANSALLFDGLTGRVRATIATGKKPDAAAYDPRTRTVWIMNPDSGNITVFDPKSAKVLATVPVAGSLELGAVDGEGRLFVNVEDRNEVAVIDTRSRALVKRFSLPGCDGPTGIAYAPDAKLLVSACANGLAIVSTRDGRTVATLPIGPRPDGVLYDPRRHVALIPSGGDGTLAVIRLSGTPRVVDRIATAKGSRTAALDPSTGRVYLPAADFAPAVGKERPKMIPGTFRVMVLQPAR